MPGEKNATTGGCRCGAVRFSFSGPPFVISYCHCADCRKASGAPVTAFTGVRKAALSVEGTPAVFRNGAAERAFCATCGTPLWYADARLADDIYLMTGALDNPDDFAPQRHAFESERLSWLHLDDGLPRYDRFSVTRPAEETK